MLEAKEISRKYIDKSGKENVILDHLNFKAEDGEFICLIGMSGCGKSTLLRLLSGLEKPTQGEILLDGKPVQKPIRIHFDGLRERNSQEFNFYKDKIYEKFNLTRKFDIEYHI